MDFNTMLDDIYSQLNDNKSKKTIVPNPVIITSTTNTYWKNIKQILKTINRPPDHFLTFINNELAETNWKTQSKSDGLVIIGKFRIDKIKKVLQKYILTYVLCNSCKSMHTSISKNKTLRTYELKCSSCLSQYTI